MGLYINVNSVIMSYFDYTTVVKKYQNETALNCCFGFAIANPIKAAIKSSFINLGLCDNVIFYNNSQ